MDDPSLHDAINDYVTADEPPMGLTSAGTLHAARRSRRAHQTFTTLGASVAALALVGMYLGAHPSGAGPGGGPGVGSSQIAGPSGGPSGEPYSNYPTSPPVHITPTPCAHVPPIDIIPPKQSPSHGYHRSTITSSQGTGTVPAATLTRLDCAVRTRMNALLPTARYYVNPDMPIESQPLRAFFPILGGTAVVEAGVVDGQAAGTFFFNVVGAGMVCSPPGTDTTGTQATTTTSTILPTGQQVCTEAVRQLASGEVSYTVWVTSGSTLVMAMCSNVYRDDRGALQVGGPAPLLTMDQLTQLAADPDLVVY